MARKATTRTDGKTDSAKQSPSQRERDLAVAGVRIPDAAQIEAEAQAATAEEAANLAAEAAELAIEAAKPAKHAYTGPMLILRQRLKAGAYGKMANGQPACGDQLAQMLGSLNSAQVIRACMIAMAIDINPYTHLNVGQQSMSLRNKLRGMLKQGVFGYGVVAEAVEEVEEQDKPATETPDAYREFKFKKAATDTMLPIDVVVYASVIEGDDATCRKVQIGVETKEVPVFAIKCD